MKKYKFKNIVKSASGIIKIVIKGVNTNIELMCTLAHLGSSLKKLCSEYGVPEQFQKLDTQDWRESGKKYKQHINKDNETQETMRWEIVEQIREYSENDVLALGYIWLVYIQTMSEICKMSKEEVIKCPTTPSLTWKSVVSKIEEN